MNINELKELVNSVLTNGTMVRNGTRNFMAVPLDPDEEGVPQYASVVVSKLGNKNTEHRAAFDFDTAAANYVEYLENQKERKAKVAAKRVPDPEKEAKAAAKRERLEKVLEWINAHPGEYTCTNIKESLPEVYADLTVMQVGTDMRTLANEDSVTHRKEAGKNYYSNKVDG